MAGSKKKKAPKWKSCKHIVKVGELINDVSPSCPHYGLIRNTCTVPKARCQTCTHWEAKE